MKAVLIQLSDIHLSNERDFIVSRLKHIAKACRTITNSADRIFVIVTGDIANTGIKKEYDVALRFFGNLEELILEENKKTNHIDYILVPGNHDCYLPDDDLRDASIDRILKSDSAASAKKSIDYCLNAQNDFWNFYKELTHENDTRFISHEIVTDLNDDFCIAFHCYNSSFLSKRQEVIGSLLIPEDFFLPQYVGEKAVITISLLHHNTGWLNPNTEHNNKKRFEEHVFTTSDIVMCGHEHSTKQNVHSSFDNENEMIYLESNAFQNGKSSSFNIIEINTDSLEIVNHNYEYKNSEDLSRCLYKEISSNNRQIKKKIKGITLSSYFEDELNRINAPLKHVRKERLLLEDIFVFPDLEPILTENDDIVPFLDSEEILTDMNLDNKVLCLEGASQSGKTSLLKMLFSSFIRQGRFPLFLKGENIKIDSINSILESTYKKQYKCNDFDYEYYQQLDRKCRIIIIDNLNRSKLNEVGRKKLFEKLLESYLCIISTIDEKIDVKGMLVPEGSDISCSRYRILSLGAYKRNLLIEKWLRIGTDPTTIDNIKLEQDVKLTLDQISSLMGNHFFTPYPIFLLTILQSLNKTLEKFEVNQTFYAYCYNSMIIYSFTSIGLNPDEQKEMINYILELAYFMYIKETKSLSQIEFEVFDASHRKRFYVSSSKEECQSELIAANILRVEDEKFLFSYKYIYYYLVAQKLAKIVSKPEGTKIVSQLCSTLHKEESANILIFLVYHTEDESLIETLILAGMYPFEKYAPITFKNDDPVVKQLFSTVDNIKNILIQDVDPIQNREKELKEQEKIEHKNEKEYSLQEHRQNIEEIENDPNLKDLYQALRCIRILGQIVKNQKASIEKKRVLDLLEGAYTTSFRMIGFFSSFIEENESIIVDYIIEDSRNKKQNIDRTKIRERVNKLLKHLLFRFCLNVFSNLAHSVGTGQKDEFYDDIAKRINTPVAKLISFTIKSYYGPMKISDLAELYKDFEGNIVAQQILKARALHYIYHNTVDIRDKQRIGQICNMKLIYMSDINKKKR